MSRAARAKSLAATKRWRKAHPAHYKRTRKRWQKRNRKKINAQALAWRRKHPRKARAINKRWRKKHGKKYWAAWRKRRRKQAAEYARRSRLRNYARTLRREKRQRKKLRREKPDLVRGWESDAQHRRRARLRNAKRIEHIDRIEIARRDRWRCKYCRRRLTRKTLTLDHVRAIAKGGNHTKKNTVAACRSCNSSKGTGKAPRRL